MFILAAELATPPQTLWTWLNQIGTVGLAFIVLALMLGWFVTKREFDALLARCAEYKKERDEYRDLYLRTVGVVGDAVGLAKQRSS